MDVNKLTAPFFCSCANSVKKLYTSINDIQRVQERRRRRVCMVVGEERTKKEKEQEGGGEKKMGSDRGVQCSRKSVSRSRLLWPRVPLFVGVQTNIWLCPE